MHLVDWSAGFAASTSIVGGTIPIGVGLAFACKLKNEPKVSVVCIGDAAVEEGVFHESANFASLHKLPVLFVSENNLYSCYTHINDRQPKRPLTDIALAHGMRHLSLEGNNVLTIVSETKPLIESVRRLEGPAFLELRTYRHLEHCGPNNDDILAYRSSDEIKIWREKDPVQITKLILQNRSEWSDARASAIEKEVEDEVAGAFAFALDAPYPQRSELGAFVYADH